jgi:hypothetical protein
MAPQPNDPDIVEMNLDFDVKTAWLRLSQQNQAEFISRIGVVLHEAMPDRVTIEYKRRTLFGPKEVFSVGVKFGEEQFKVTTGIDMPVFSLFSVEQKPDPLLALKFPAPSIMGLISKGADGRHSKPVVTLTSRLGGVEAAKEGMTVNIGGKTKLAVVETTLTAGDWVNKLTEAVSKQSDLAENFLRSMQTI